VNGISVPSFLYGTAWKEERTETLTRLALQAGFTGVDTANQRRHYVEAGVGSAVAAAIASGSTKRSDVFLQTKFTYAAGQDHRIPYDPSLDPAAQVRQSFESSLEHLGTSHVDSYVLHGPSSRRGLTQTDYATWHAMEELHGTERARLIGVSNVSLEQLTLLVKGARVVPAFVQNRCFASTGWDHGVRAFCASQGIVYQGFSLLTANEGVLESAIVGEISDKVGRSPEAVVFRFALEVGMLPLTGTTNPEHMKDALGSLDFSLDPEDVRAIERAGLG
jgi:diketogulonate reductase-like aldo/keto reductase